MVNIFIFNPQVHLMCTYWVLLRLLPKWCYAPGLAVGCECDFEKVVNWSLFNFNLILICNAMQIFLRFCIKFTLLQHGAFCAFWHQIKKEKNTFLEFFFLFGGYTVKNPQEENQVFHTSAAEHLRAETCRRFGDSNTGSSAWKSARRATRPRRRPDEKEKNVNTAKTSMFLYRLSCCWLILL